MDIIQQVTPYLVFIQQYYPLVVASAPNLIGVVLPPFIHILNKKLEYESDSSRFIISIMICFVVAFILKGNSLQHGSIEEMQLSFGLIFAESQAVYKLYFQDSWLKSKIDQRLDKLPEPDAIG